MTSSDAAPPVEPDRDPVTPNARSQPPADTAHFLRTIHGGGLSGYIELRLIEDRKRGKVVERLWHPTAEAVLVDLPRLLDIAEKKNAAIFYGVLRRRGEGKGKAADCLAGAVVWSDIDFKDFHGGEAEARQRVEAFPSSPSVAVRSGHGLHLFWLLREPSEPDELSKLSQAVARALGGDHTHDAARLLRLPGTFNRKDPQHPLLVEIETFEPDRAYNASELRDALEVCDARTIDSTPTASDSSRPPALLPDELPERVRALIRSRKRIGLLFNGQGKPELGPDGRLLDKSSSGYDFSLVLALAKAGVRDPSDLAAALWHRPGGDARAKGTEYISRTVRKALDLFEQTEQASVDVAVDFRVERVRIFDSNPARYEFTVDGVAFTVDSPKLCTHRKFAVAFMDALHRVPSLPSDSEDWVPLVNHWLRGAERVQMPPDASHEPALQERIGRIVAEMVVGDAVEDLDRAKAVLLADGTKGFRLSAVLRALKDDFPEVESGDAGRVLKTLGYGSHSTTVGGVAVRVWRSDGPTPDTRAGES